MNVRWWMVAGLAFAAGLGACDDPSLDPGVPGGEPNDAADPSDMNRPGGDPSEANPPFQQNEQAGDLQTTAAVRRAILDAEDLGVAADNAVITTQAGVVTLRGNVESQTVKDRVEAIARDVAGVTRIDNQLTVGGTTRGTGDDEPNDGAQAPNPR